MDLMDTMVGGAVGGKHAIRQSLLGKEVSWGKEGSKERGKRETETETETCLLRETTERKQE